MYRSEKPLVQNHQLLNLMRTGVLIVSLGGTIAAGITQVSLDRRIEQQLNQEFSDSPNSPLPLKAESFSNLIKPHPESRQWLERKISLQKQAGNGTNKGLATWDSIFFFLSASAASTFIHRRRRIAS